MTQRQLWIGLVEVRPLGGGNEILEGTKGAFVNLVTWASSSEEYRKNADLIVERLGGLFVSEVVSPEPVEVRRSNGSGHFEEEIEDMISRAKNNPNAIIYGTFHTFESDNA